MRPLDFLLIGAIVLCIYGALDPDGAAALVRAAAKLMPWH